MPDDFAHIQAEKRDLLTRMAKDVAYQMKNNPAITGYIINVFQGDHMTSTCGFPDGADVESVQNCLISLAENIGRDT